MDNDNHKNTWNNFTKFVLWGTVAVVLVLVLMAIFLLQASFMKVGSILENQNLEKRIAITPEIIKKYTSLGFEIFHIGRITSKKNSINFLDGNKKIDFDLSKEYEHF